MGKQKNRNKKPESARSVDLLTETRWSRVHCQTIFKCYANISIENFPNLLQSVIPASSHGENKSLLILFYF